MTSLMSGRTAVRAGVLVVAAALTASACGGDDGGGESGGQVTIAIAGPNQWTTDPDTFGPAWEDLVARFEEEEPGINVETNVLPADFGDTLSTQLAAGTAPELIFRSVSHTADQVVALDDYLQQPNPYVEGNERWIDLFNQDYFGPDAVSARNAAGNYEFIPFNLVILGLFYNADALADAGLDGPPETFGELISACGDLRDAGYDPFAITSGFLNQGWTVQNISSMLMARYADDWNKYGPDNEPGTSATVSIKSMARAILTGELDPTTIPEVGETLRLTKEFYDECATENWSGITTGGGFEDLLSGKAAMAYASNFYAPLLDDVDFEWGAMPFPDLTEQDSPLSTGEPARHGANTEGTSYMIPSTTTGEELEAAVKFLQFITSPEGGQPWLDGSGGIPSLEGATPAPGLEPLMTGVWAEPLPVQSLSSLVPKAKFWTPIYDGYLLESTSLEDTLAGLREDWIQWANEQVEDGGWTDDWTQG